MYRTSGHFPYYRDAQYPPMYHHPAGSALDLAQHRLAAGIDASEARSGRKPGTRVMTVRSGTCGIQTLLLERTARASS